MALNTSKTDDRRVSRSSSASRQRAAPQAPKKALSPRGRGSVPKPADDDQLLVLFANNVRLVRLHRGLSQEVLADLADLDRTYISSTERRLRNISIRNIQRIAAALSVDPRVLLDPDLKNSPEITG